MNTKTAQKAHALISKANILMGAEARLNCLNQDISALSIKNVEDVLYELGLSEEAQKIKREAFIRAHDLVLSQRRLIEHELEKL